MNFQVSNFGYQVTVLKGEGLLNSEGDWSLCGSAVTNLMGVVSQEAYAMQGR